MKLLERLASLGAVMVSAGFVLVVKGALAPGVSPVLLGGLALGVVGVLGSEALSRWGQALREDAERAQEKEQAALVARLAEVEKQVKSLTNTVGMGSWK